MSKKKKSPRHRTIAAMTTKHRLGSVYDSMGESAPWNSSFVFHCACGHDALGDTYHDAYEAFGKHLADAAEAARIVEGAVVIVRRDGHPLHTAVGTVKVASQHSSFVDFDGKGLRLLHHADIERVR